MDWKPLYSIESRGNAYGWFGLKIEVDAKLLPDLKSARIWSVVRDSAEKIRDEVLAASLALDPETKITSEKQRQALIGIFPTPIFVEPIPNGYCSNWCCRHLPWFVVTTTIGRFKIGFRKSVIHLEWTETVVTKTAEELFPDAQVTKTEKIIHAWSLENAREYVAKVMAAAPVI